MNSTAVYSSCDTRSRTNEEIEIADESVSVILILVAHTVPFPHLCKNNKTNNNYNNNNKTTTKQSAAEI